MVKNLVIAVVALCFAVSVSAEKLIEGFEDKDVLKKMEIEGDVAISADQKHAGNSSLFVPVGATATWRFSKENKFGTVTMWVYESLINIKVKNMKGPHFGLINSDDDKAVLIGAVKLSSQTEYYRDIFTAENQWYSVWTSGFPRAPAGWKKFTFTFTDDKTLGVTLNDDAADKIFPGKVAFFNKGANGVIFGGGTDMKKNNETFYFDDVEVDVSDTAKAASKETSKEAPTAAPEATPKK